MKRHGKPWHLRAASIIPEWLPKAFERTFSILFGLIPAIFLLAVAVAGTVLVLLDNNLSMAQKAEGCATFLFLSAALSFLSVNMFIGTFYGDRAKGLSEGAGRAVAWTFSLLPMPVKNAARSISSALGMTFDYLARVIGIVWELCAKVALWIIGAAIVIGLAMMAFQTVAALPVSVAIIIGAFIIALALLR